MPASDTLSAIPGFSLPSASRIRRSKDCGPPAGLRLAWLPLEAPGALGWSGIVGLAAHGPGAWHSATGLPQTRR